MESVGRLAGGIAHDFNNLLTAILGYTELLLSDRPAEDPDRPALEEIQKAGQRAAALTHQLLAFSRKQVLLPQDVDLNQTVLGLQSMLTRLIREDITLHCEVADEPALVKIDPTQIEQAILNLVLNARDALPARRMDSPRRGAAAGVGGRASARRRAGPGVCAAAGGRQRRRHSGRRAAAPVRAVLHHEGAGEGHRPRARIGPRHRASEPRVDRRRQRTGARCGVRDALSGDRRQRPRVEPTPAAPVEPARGDETILLVEDEEAVRTIVAAVLRRQGYTVDRNRRRRSRRASSSIDTVTTSICSSPMS